MKSMLKVIHVLRQSTRPLHARRYYPLGLELQQAFRRVDDDAAGVEIYLGDDLFHRRDEIFLLAVFDDVEIAAGRRPEPRDRADSRARGVEDLHAYYLIIVIFILAQRRQVDFGDAHDGADPFLGCVDTIDAGEMDEQLALVRLDAFEPYRRAHAVFFEENFFGGKKGRAVGVVG